MPSEPEPLSTPWSLNPAPEILSNIIVEWVDSENAPGSYVRLAPGTPYPDQEKFPGYIFLAQQTISQNKVKRYWCTPAFYNEDVYNYARDYVSDSSAHPIFIRQYKTRRDQYTELTRGFGGTLSGVWLIKLTNAGSGYDPDNPPSVTIAGTGTGATAVAMVNPDTSLSWIRITAEGSGYAGAVTVTIDPPSAGVQATATATIQATSCVLIKQTTQNFPEDDPRFGLFLLETRVYQTFPGPYIDRWDWEPRIERYVKVRKRLIHSSRCAGLEAWMAGSNRPLSSERHPVVWSTIIKAIIRRLLSTTLLYCLQRLPLVAGLNHLLHKFGKVLELRAITIIIDAVFQGGIASFRNGEAFRHCRYRRHVGVGRAILFHMGYCDHAGSTKHLSDIECLQFLLCKSATPPILQIVTKVSFLRQT